MNENFFIHKLDDEFQPNHEKTEDGYFTESDYEELQRNLILYKEGNREAVTYIVRTFHPFLTKYTRFIVDGNLPYYTYIDKKGIEHRKVSITISQFVSLFIEKGSEETNRKKMFSTACIKIKALFSKYEYGDIYNELVLALLNMANKYKIITDKSDPHYKKNGTFHMYVSKCFHWEAHRFLTKLVTDPLSHFEVLKLRDQFDEMDLEELTEGKDVFIEDESAQFVFDEMFETVSRQNSIQQSTKLTMKEDENISAYDIDSLNFNWTNGVTCSELFKVLTPYEREIIILSFIKNKSEVEISDIYGYHRATINTHKKRAIAKIQVKAKELNVLEKE